MPPPLHIVFNLGSGHGDAEATRTRIADACAAAGRSVRLIEVLDPRQLPDLAAQAVRAARADGGIVVAAGGDGTINAVAQAVLGSGCTFGVLPQGTFNYFSRAHGIPDDLDAALQLLLTGRPQPVQVGLVNGRVFLVNASLGLYPRLLEDREAWKRQLGRSRLVAGIALLATLLRGHRSLRLILEAADGASRPQALRTPTLFIGNNPLQLAQIGLPQAQAVEGGALAMVALRPVGRLALLGLALRGALGRLGEADQVIAFSSRSLSVQPGWPWNPRGVKVATDGEVRRLRAPLRFSVSPQPLYLIQPPPFAGGATETVATVTPAGVSLATPSASAIATAFDPA